MKIEIKRRYLLPMKSRQVYVYSYKKHSINEIIRPYYQLEDDTSENGTAVIR